MKEMKKIKRISPKLAGGFRDYLPDDAKLRIWMRETIENEFKKFCFLPLETSSVEKYDVLTGGEAEMNKQIFRLVKTSTENKSDDIALRFDLTVPLARFVASNSSVIRFPFKRYQIGKVWRGERQQLGRFKELTQCDADIVGSKRMEADAEIIALIWYVISRLGIKNIKIRINNRKILEGLPDYAEYEPRKNKYVMRAIDKVDKKGWSAVKKELNLSPISLSSIKISAIENFLNTKKSTPLKTLSAMKEKVSNIKIAKEGIEELYEIAKLLDSFNVPKSVWEIDFSLARGLSYYTGPIFEAVILSKEAFGSVAGGGRYDNLIKRFSPISMPSVGVAIGFDRLFEAIQDIITKKDFNAVDVEVLNFDEGCISDVQKLSMVLRNFGINTELYLGQDNTIRGQISHAISCGARFICMIGNNEKKKNIVTVKDVKTRKQKEVKLSDIGKYIVDRL